MDRKDWPTAVYPFETPDRDDRAFYAALTPAERIAIPSPSCRRSTLNSDWIELLGSLAARTTVD